MFGFQMLLTGLVLVGYGVFLARGSRERAERYRNLPRAQRTLGGLGALVGGVALLFGGLGLSVSLGLLGKGALGPLVWVGVVVLGVAFVHLQTVGGILLASLALSPSVSSETNLDSPASNERNSTGS